MEKFEMPPRMSRGRAIVLLLLVLIMACANQSAYCHQQHQQLKPPLDYLDGSAGPAGGASERVENGISSASGDQYWQLPNQQQDLSDNQIAAPLIREPIITWSPYKPDYGQQTVLGPFKMAPILSRLPYGGGGSLDYRALINDFKQQQQHLFNPMREGRAFKPRLMSTARGFGKRNYAPAASVSQSRLINEDLLAALINASSGNTDSFGAASKVGEQDNLFIK